MWCCSQPVLQERMKSNHGTTEILQNLLTVLPSIEENARILLQLTGESPWSFSSAAWRAVEMPDLSENWRAWGELSHWSGLLKTSLNFTQFLMLGKKEQEQDVPVLCWAIVVISALWDIWTPAIDIHYNCIAQKCASGLSLAVLWIPWL